MIATAQHTSVNPRPGHNLNSEYNYQISIGLQRGVPAFTMKFERFMQIDISCRNAMGYIPLG